MQKQLRLQMGASAAPASSSDDASAAAVGGLSERPSASSGSLDLALVPAAQCRELLDSLANPADLEHAQILSTNVLCGIGAAQDDYVAPFHPEYLRSYMTGVGPLAALYTPGKKGTMQHAETSFQAEAHKLIKPVEVPANMKLPDKVRYQRPCGVLCQTVDQHDLKLQSALLKAWSQLFNRRCAGKKVANLPGADLLLAHAVYTVDYPADDEDPSAVVFATVDEGSGRSGIEQEHYVFISCRLLRGEHFHPLPMQSCRMSTRSLSSRQKSSVPP